MKKTLLVLGAGATKDIFWFFPTGFELIKEINYHLITELRYPSSPDKGPCLSPLMNELLRALSDSNGQFIKKAIPLDYLDKRETQDFFKSTQTLKTLLWDKVLSFEYNSPRDKKFSTEFISIDDFLYQNFQDNPSIRNIAQYAITYLLVGCESALKYKIDNCYENWIDDNWINAFFEKCSSYGLNEILNNTKVVTFNYERTFEFFFERYLTKRFGVLPKDTINSFFENNIKHVYGKIGSVNSLPFGQLDNDDTAGMKNIFQNFDLMYFDRKNFEWNPKECFDQTFFIGFGYDESNITKLCLDKITCGTKKGTGKGISPDKQIHLSKKHTIETCTTKTCKDFILKQTI